jgi:glycosyltransferase involved in cell wall biosynthesis
MKLISIAMCTYNGEKYLREQLDSLIHQTYKNLEIIIVDDSSNDSTMNILKKYEQLDRRIKVFHNEKNLGFIQNFSKAISLCSGDYIALSDQDDIWKLEKLELFLSEIGDHTLIYSDAILIDNEGQELNQYLIHPKKNLVSGHCNKAFLLNNCVSGNTLMFKSELVKKILPIPDVSFHDTWIAFVASSLGAITYTSEPMTFYRRHTDQVTVKKVKSNRLNFIARYKKKRLEKKEMANNALKDMNAYKGLIDNINDTDTQNILNLLIDHYNKFNDIYIDYSLRKKLLPYKDELIAIFPKKRKNKRFNSVAYGLNYYQLTLFIQ